MARNKIKNPHEIPLEWQEPSQLAVVAEGYTRARKQARMEQLIEEYGGLKNVPAGMRGVIEKSKRFSHRSEKPRGK